MAKVLGKGLGSGGKTSPAGGSGDAKKYGSATPKMGGYPWPTTKGGVAEQKGGATGSNPKRGRSSH